MMVESSSVQQLELVLDAAPVSEADITQFIRLIQRIIQKQKQAEQEQPQHHEQTQVA
jgi:hypothetical protein